MLRKTEKCLDQNMTKKRCVDQDRMDRNHNVRSSHLCSLTDTFCSCCWAKTYVHAIRSWWGTDIVLATSILYHINNKFNLHFQNKISPDHIQIQKRKLPILHRTSRIGTVFFSKLGKRIAEELWWRLVRWNVTQSVYLGDWIAVQFCPLCNTT